MEQEAVRSFGAQVSMAQSSLHEAGMQNATPKSAAVASLADLQGELYTDVLKRLHMTLLPRTYFEIGSYSGDSLAPARGKVIAVDPNFAALTNVFAGKLACHLFQMTSDAFFKDNDPRLILGDEIDLAFLDGMHLYEYLLRDFSNVERFCRPNSDHLRRI